MIFLCVTCHMPPKKNNGRNECLQLIDKMHRLGYTKTDPADFVVCTSKNLKYLRGAHTQVELAKKYYDLIVENKGRQPRAEDYDADLFGVTPKGKISVEMKRFTKSMYGDKNPALANLGGKAKPNAGNRRPANRPAANRPAANRRGSPPPPANRRGSPPPPAYAAPLGGYQNTPYYRGLLEARRDAVQRRRLQRAAGISNSSNYYGGETSSNSNSNNNRPQWGQGMNHLLPDQNRVVRVSCKGEVIVRCRDAAKPVRRDPTDPRRVVLVNCGQRVLVTCKTGRKHGRKNGPAKRRRTNAGNALAAN